MLKGYIDPGSGYTLFALGGGVIALLLGIAGFLLLFIKKVLKSLLNHKIIAVFIISGIALLTIVIILAPMKKTNFKDKIIILGFDGLSPEILEPMMDQGRLPNFQRLRSSGSYSRLITTNPPQSPVAWAAFATGRNPGKNGVFDFIKRDPRTYSLDLSTSTFSYGKPKKAVRSLSFWDYTSRLHVPAVVLWCPLTFPPSKLYGKMIAGMGVPDIKGTEGTFSFYTTVPGNGKKETGGTVLVLDNNETIETTIDGPKVSTLTKKNNVCSLPLTISRKKDGTVSLSFSDSKIILHENQWSDWQEVAFPVSPFKKIKGIVKFYLISSYPELNVYMSPINYDPRDPYFTISYPSGYSREIVDHIGLYHTQGMPFDTWAVNERRLGEGPFLEQATEIFSQREKLLYHELEQLHSGILFSYFESSDIIQHMFWRFIDEGHPLHIKPENTAYNDVIYSWYEKLDRVIGNVLSNISENDTLIVLSDHGFGTFRTAAHVNSWLHKNGYLYFMDKTASEGQALFANVDWSKTKAYSIGFGAIYINMQGRERYGIVAPNDVETLSQELRAKLQQWKDPETNDTIVNEVYTKEQMFSGPYTNEAPDMYIGFKRGYRASWQSALGAAPNVLMEKNIKKWSGSHLFDYTLIPGIIVSNKKITKNSPSLYDITPTILQMLSYSEEDMSKLELDGSSLFN